MMEAAQIADFEAMIDDLKRRGWSTRTIATEIDVSVSSIVDYRNGATPQYHVGERIIAAWCGATGNDRTRVPTTRSYPTASKIRGW